MKVSIKEDIDEEDVSDYLCIRCPYPDDKPQDLHQARGAMWVGHAIAMQTSTNEKHREESTKVTLKFKLNQTANSPPPAQMFEQKGANCTVEFITKPLPHRYGHSLSLRNLCMSLQWVCNVKVGLNIRFYP